MLEPSSESPSVKLNGGLPGTATFLYSKPDGSIVIELYDHSNSAESSFGNDVAFLLHVAVEQKARMLLLLCGAVADPGADDSMLFALLRDRFGDYYELKRWLDAEGIAYQKEFDSWA